MRKRNLVSVGLIIKCQGEQGLLLRDTRDKVCLTSRMYGNLDWSWSVIGKMYLIRKIKWETVNDTKECRS